MHKIPSGDAAAILPDLPNDLKNKVTPSGPDESGGLDPELLARAEQAVEAMNDSLLETMTDDMKRLENACKKAENEAENRDTHLQELESAAHQIKGYGNNIGFNLLTQFGHTLSQCLRQPDLDGTIKMQLARAHVDSMNLVFRHQIKGSGGEAGATLASALDQAISKFRPSK